MGRKKREEIGRRQEKKWEEGREEGRQGGQEGAQEGGQTGEEGRTQEGGQGPGEEGDQGARQGHQDFPFPHRNVQRTKVFVFHQRAFGQMLQLRIAQRLQNVQLATGK